MAKAQRGGPGRPTGHPKSGGRKPGVPNKATAEIKAMAQKHGPEVIRGFVKLFRTSKDEDIKVRSGQELLNRGYGRPAQAVHHGGHEGGPLRLMDLNLEELNALATRLEHTLALPEGADSGSRGD